MHGWDAMWHSGFMWFWWLFAIVIVVAVVWRLAGGGGTRTESPEEILKLRYARGEIDREEYERRRSDLRD